MSKTSNMKQLLSILLTFILTSCDSKKSQTSHFDYIRAGACATGAATDLPGIVGGQIVQERSLLGKSNVLVMQAAWNESGAVVDQTTCSGILLDSDIVLTAAHCADFLYEKTDLETKVEVSFRARPECDREGAQKEQIKVSRVLIHPSWIQGVFRHKTGQPVFSGVHFPDKRTQMLKLFGDIALLKLEKPAPDYKQPALLPGKFVALDSNTIYASGFGTPVKYSDYGKTELALRYTKLKPLKNTGLAMNLIKAEDGASPPLEDQLLRLVKQNRQNKSDQELLIFDQTGGSGVCSGDSGGPAVIVKDRQLVVLGVAAAVYAVKSRETCGHLAMHTSTSFYDSWITDSYAKLKGASALPLKKADVK